METASTAHSHAQGNTSSTVTNILPVFWVTIFPSTRQLLNSEETDEYMQEKAASCRVALRSCPKFLIHTEPSCCCCRPDGTEASLVTEARSPLTSTNPHTHTHTQTQTMSCKNNSSSQLMQISPINLCVLTLSVSASLSPSLSLSVSLGLHCPSRSLRLSHECLMVLPAAL